MEKQQENSKDAAKKREQQRLNDIKKDLSEKYKKMQSKFIYQSGYEERQWLKKHGKEDCIQFTDEEINELRNYFASLDYTGAQSIGVEELEDPLIALGLANSREDVLKLIEAVDEDGSGQIEFREFLTIMSSAQNNENEAESRIYKFFKSMIKKDSMDSMDPSLPFKLNVSQFRRKKLLDSIMSMDAKKKEEGSKILNAFKKQLTIQKQQQKIAKGENPNDISLDQIPNNEHGVNIRNGFPKQPRIINSNTNFLIKPKSTTIQSHQK